MIFGYLDALMEEEIIRRLVKYNDGIVLCFTWMWGSLIVLTTPKIKSFTMGLKYVII